jgi:hypothetical protein
LEIANARTDLGGLEGEVWAEGISRATGKPCAPTRGVSNIQALRDALAIHAPPGLDARERAAWLRDAIAAYATARAGQTYSPKWFVEWLDSRHAKPAIRGVHRTPLSAPRPKPAFSVEAALAESKRQRAEGVL